ncbi:MAG: hypothetical protein ACRDZ3_04075 [Acidimicrobiia bacterium]
MCGGTKAGAVGAVVVGGAATVTGATVDVVVEELVVVVGAAVVDDEVAVSAGATLALCRNLTVVEPCRVETSTANPTTTARHCLPRHEDAHQADAAQPPIVPANLSAVVPHRLHPRSSVHIVPPDIGHFGTDLEASSPHHGRDLATRPMAWSRQPCLSATDTSVASRHPPRRGEANGADRPGRCRRRSRGGLPWAPPP